MFRLSHALIILLLFTTSLSAAPVLNFDTSGDLLVITAEEDDASASYWQIELQVTGARQGRIVGFYDLTGDAGSSSTYNYTRDTKCGLLGPLDGHDMGLGTSPWSCTVGSYADGDRSFTYTLTDVSAHNGGVRTRTSVVTIHAPNGAGTLITSTNSWVFDEDNLGDQDCDVRPRPRVVLAASDDAGAGDEFTLTSQGLTTDDLSVGTAWATAVVNAGVTDMAAGRSFKLSAVAVDDGDRSPGDVNYNNTIAEYTDYGGAVAHVGMAYGASRRVKARSVAGACAYGSYTTLEINIGTRPVLNFETVGDNLEITASESDDSADYWKIVLQTGGTSREGRVVGFYDLTGDAGSNATYNYTRDTKSGLFGPLDGHDMGLIPSPWVCDVGSYADGDTSFTYTLTDVSDHNGGVRTRVSDVTIHAPTTSGTLIEADNTWDFDTDNLGELDRDVRPRVLLILAASDDTGLGDEFTFTSQGLTTDDLSVGNAWGQAAVKANVTDMAEGRAFKITAIDVDDADRSPGDVNYNIVLADYTDYGGAVGRVSLLNGASRRLKARSAAGEQSYSCSASLEINIAADTTADIELAPIVNAGPDQLVFAASATLAGAVVDDDQATVTVAWTQKAGPAGVTFGDDDALNSTVTFASYGTFILEVTATDSDGLTASDTVEITAEPALVTGAYYVDQDHPSASDSNAGTAVAPWLTIKHAVDNVSAGDTIYVKEGIYREYVRMTVSGTSAEPITLQAFPGHRAVLSGGRVLTGWTQCTSVIAHANNDYASIYYVDIDFKPQGLFQDGIPVDHGRYPASGWWVADSGTTTTLADTTHLTQADDYWNGAEIFAWNWNETQMGIREVTDFDAATDTLTFTALKFDVDTPDLYFLRGKVEFIDDDSQWAFEDLGNGNWRIFLWPAADADPDDCLIEAPDPGIEDSDRFLLELHKQGYWIIDGLEIRHGVSHGVGGYSTPTPGHNTIQNCSIHHVMGTGIYEKWSSGNTIRNNYIGHNGMGDLGGVGITLLETTSDFLIEGNDIDANAKDGIKVTGTGHTIRGNYVHGHWFYQHADNIQTSGTTSDTVVEDNLVLNGGQNFMLSGMTGLVLDNNAFVGSRAYSIIFNDDDLALTNNTLAFSGNGLLNTNVDADNDQFDFSDNIFMPGHMVCAFVMDSDRTFASDYNLFYFADSIDEDDWRVVIWDNNWTSRGLAEYQTESGADANSLFGDPMFTNAPGAYVRLDKDEQINFTSTRVYLDSSDVSAFAVDDHIEIDWDGVVRTVTAVGTDYIDFTPAEPRVVFKAIVVANWGAATDFTLDLTPASGSPAIGAGSTGGNIGCSIDTVDYAQGDFDGDGVRDCPIWPEDPSKQ